MPPSQLKRLKASLREQGITGPQKSKKEKKQRHGANADQRIQRQAALQGIRDSFNPFEVKAPNRPTKFQITSNRPTDGKGAVGRPGVTKSMGEEARRQTLLPEMQRRNKTGGILDRRIGENDPTMTPEERALQRFAREKQRKKGASMFDLEEVDDDEVLLTHGGRALDLANGADGRDDFDAEGLSDAGSDLEDRPLKRRRPSAGIEDVDGEVDSPAEDGEEPARKKSKAEVMKEVIAKSKLHKYERQKAKEDDDDLREELDKGMSDMLALLRGHKPAPSKPAETALSGEAGMNPERLAMLQGMSREEADKQYDIRLRQMAIDKRAAPTERTKTAEEKAAEEAQRLKDLEQSRLRRMQGEEDEDEEDERPHKSNEADMDVDDEEIPDDAAAFGFIAPQAKEKPLVLEDEDEFVMEDDLIASGSDMDATSESGESGSDESEDEDAPRDVQDDEEDEFVRGILSKDDKERPDLNGAVKAPPATTDSGKRLAYTYQCPRTHAELLGVIKGISAEEVPTVVQRIRALYHPSLSAENKEKLADFSVALVDHISYMAATKQALPVVETLIRHIHSLSRTYPETIAKAFRTHLSAFHARGAPTPGDLAILTAIGSIYPTSDHFHQVVTPAITLMARWLGMTAPTASPSTPVTGAFLVALCVRYQRLSKRYVPEAVRFTLQALLMRPVPNQAALAPHVSNLVSMAELWGSKSAFAQIFAPGAVQALSSLKSSFPAAAKALQTLKIQLSQSRLKRRPLELHHHKPLAIKTSVPKFEDAFNPDKHYDPDRERAEASKLRAEYKRERKGALRELRKDANFMAREQLREKRERDAEYERKYKRLVAEIQGEEGHEKNVYERQKRLRKNKR